MATRLGPVAALFAAACSVSLAVNSLGADVTDTRRVVVSVVGKDTGRFRVDLPPAAFEIKEDDESCVVSSATSVDQPVAVAFLLDYSGSLKDTRIAVEPESRRKTILQFMGAGAPESEYLAIGFASEVRLLTPFTRDPETLSGLENVNLGIRTALFDAIELAIDQLRSQEGKRKAIVIFSDFREDNSSKTSLGDALGDLQKEGIALFAVVLPRWRRYRESPTIWLAEALSQESGGLALYSRKYLTLPEETAALGRLLRYCYVVDYVAPEKTKAKPRDKIKLRVGIRKEIAGERCAAIAPPHP